MPKEQFSSGIAVAFNLKGWTNKDVMKFWHEKCYRTRPNSFFNRKSLLVMDSMAAHLEDSVKSYQSELPIRKQ